MTTAVFGRTSVGAFRSLGAAGNLDVSGPYVLAAASVSKLTGYLSGGNSSTKVRAVIYSDYRDPGQPVRRRVSVPGDLIGVTREVTIPAGAAPGWVDFTLPSPIALPTGQYWLGYWYGGKQSYEYYDGVGGNERFGSAAYSSNGNPPSPFGPVPKLGERLLAVRKLARPPGTGFIRSESSGR